MKSLFFILPFTLGGAFGAKDVPKIDDYYAPGRVDRLFYKRAPKSWDCDEWPPALVQQLAFDPNPQVRPPNSLRCMSDTENRSLGGKLGQFIRSKRAARDDFFRMDLTTNIGTANLSKVQYCLNTYNDKTEPDCTQDGHQFGMVQKGLKGGKISSLYDNVGNFNRYKFLSTPYKEVCQCCVKFMRDGITIFGLPS
ncbi:hypothetical protein P153DRAFT_397355 [Dothidotthia symphoricarpi CBS 119687]|uniref:Deoxyribonuclease NucA/NucB domain-containing protein n=1 Tax=Dothidotthia symphoricarpi CBS 119687 TaxID=1392245 RepID=A0A6A6ABJ8_9PLEO|nr:uncharacterized protein P153DRAFT_397355 [Dothidotthia symphoricarpi CBS 119687]KAF2128258.1 hypothetical protein P153DRAFT_397355 [Dothidotthia symphoricarpi CBS 119687]